MPLFVHCKRDSDVLQKLSSVDKLTGCDMFLFLAKMYFILYVRAVGETSRARACLHRNIYAHGGMGVGEGTAGRTAREIPPVALFRYLSHAWTIRLLFITIIICHLNIPRHWLHHTSLLFTWSPKTEGFTFHEATSYILPFVLFLVSFFKYIHIYTFGHLKLVFKVHRIGALFGGQGWVNG